MLLLLRLLLLLPLLAAVRRWPAVAIRHIVLIVLQIKEQNSGQSRDDCHGKAHPARLAQLGAWLLGCLETCRYRVAPGPTR